MPKKNFRSTAGSANVFADLGFPNAGDMLAKAELVRQINKIIEDRGLTQAEAAKILKISQPNVSLLKTGRLTEFSLDRLLRCLVSLGQEVQIRVRPAARPGLRIKRADAA
jgi:predicted XRE-type DNA-binding protein